MAAEGDCIGSGINNKRTCSYSKLFKNSRIPLPYLNIFAKQLIVRTK